MCGIVGGANLPPGDVDAAMRAVAHRGPDGHDVADVDRWTLGHVRLAIQDTSDAAAQPMRRGDTTIAYTGELWHPEVARAAAPAPLTSTGDTEPLAWWLDADRPLVDLDGMWGMAWVRDGALHLSRDRFGEVPLHWGRRRDRSVVFASEIGSLLALGAHPATVRWVPPGSTLRFGGPADDPSVIRWYDVDDVKPSADTLADAQPVVRRLLAEGTANRTIADVPVACLLSGGIDSSAVLLHAIEAGLTPTAYVAVFDERARDLRCAREVADHLGVRLVEVRVPAPTADDLADVVDRIEMPHKAQVEIAWPCLALARRMRDDGVRVVLSGEGSDELWASYHRAFREIRLHPGGWHGYRRDSFVGQHRKNFARCNKVFMAHGIECRLPFLHPPLVEYGLTLARDSVFGCIGRNTTGTKEKVVLRGAYTQDGDLPASVILRDKAAFQLDGGFAKAAADAIADPTRFYRAEFKRAFQGVKP